MCCICRDPAKGIIIHHIIDWHISRNHNEDNLIVLCLDHHDLAHTKKDLSLNLTPERLSQLKTKWIDEVNFKDSQAILGLIGDWSRCDYVNINRIFELFLNFNINPSSFKTFASVLHYSIIDRKGLISSISEWKVDQNLKNI